MTSFPTPLIPPVRPRPLLPFHTACWATPDGRGGWWIDCQRGRVGHAFPQVVLKPDGKWFVKEPHQDADLKPSEAAALAYLVGCDPEDITFEEAR